jgi:hypothetical protein
MAERKRIHDSASWQSRRPLYRPVSLQALFRITHLEQNDPSELSVSKLAALAHAAYEYPWPIFSREDKESEAGTLTGGAYDLQISHYLVAMANFVA